MDTHRSSLRHAMLVAALTTLGLTAVVWAADMPAHEHEHEHVSSSSQSAPADAATAAAMQRMQAMHEKMVAAKTPAERQALMKEHMQVMQESMKAMQQMGHGHGQSGMSESMMQQRMDMMTMMMQMMMDHQSGMTMEPPKPPATK